MDVLLKCVTVVHKPSEFHLKNVDILIKDGVIAKISHQLSSKNVTLVEGKQLYCSVGLCDIGTHSGEPGYEHRETIQSLTKSALKGGFTALAVFPNTKPITQNKSQIHYLKNHADRNNVSILPIGALSKDINGQDLAEYFDMSEAGAIGFSDGLDSVHNSGLLSRAMQYVSTTGRVLIHHPDDQTLSSGSEMNEGEVSTLLGMKGHPSIAEVHTVHRDILLVEYNDASLILHAISASESVDMIKDAKKKGLKITATVPYLNILKTDGDLTDFDQNLKVKPPLRSEKDKKALIKGLKDDTIDVIISNHVPLDEEVKNLEFPYALHGAAGLETCLPACLTSLQKSMGIEKIIEKLTINPRKILNLDIPAIEVGAKANLCVFETGVNWEYKKNESSGKALNNPFFDRFFTAKVVYTIC